MFQSLFFWIHFYNSPVSTLASISSVSFNPCFSGFTSTTRQSFGQSLAFYRFQSLFFWIHFYNQDALDVVLGLRRVSILVFLDSLLQRRLRGAAHQSLSAFQSLFFWIHFYNPTKCGVRGWNIACFQSLFFWIHFYNILGPERCRRRTSAFQSLFFWIHFYNGEIPTRSGKRRRRFNPCFSGFTSTTGSNVRMQLDLDVSILVFLDSLLQRDIDRFFACDPNGFNPCFSGFTSTTAAKDSVSNLLNGVSILVFLDSLLQL